MTPAQCRAGRALVELSQSDLAKAADIGISTMVDFEKSRRAVSAEAISKIMTALEAAGVVFLDECAQADAGHGVRLRRDPAA